MKLKILAAGLVLATAVVVVVVSRTKPQAQAGPLMPRRIVARGAVEPLGGARTLAFELEGRVVELLVEEGAKVEAGQVLARVDDRLLRARTAQAEAAVAIAEARRDRVTRGARSQELQVAEAALQSSSLAAEELGATRARAERLRAANTVSDAELETARRASDAAVADVQAARARVSLLRAGSRDEERREAEAAVAASKADLEAARATAARAELRSPCACVVLRRLIEIGESVTLLPPTPVLRLGDLSRLQVRVEVNEAFVAGLKLGTPAFVTTVAFGERKFPGKVVRIRGELGRRTVSADDPRAQVDTRVLELDVELEGTTPLTPGMRVDVELPGG